MLPDDLLAEARARAGSEGLSLAELVRRGLEQFLGRGTRTVTAADPFLADQSTFASAVGDLAENHDEHLYGKKRGR
jgi:hypothetical protein